MGLRDQVGLEFVQVDIQRAIKRNEAVTEDTTWAISLLRLEKEGDWLKKFFLQML